MLLVAPAVDQRSIIDAASKQMKLWENVLELRIALQVSTDVANKIDLNESSTAGEHNMFPLFHNMVNLLEVQSSNHKAHKKSKKDDEYADAWKQLSTAQNSLKPNWECVINKWHARLNFGSDGNKAKLKVFNQTIFDQVSLFPCFITVLC